MLSKSSVPGIWNAISGHSTNSSNYLKRYESGGCMTCMLESNWCKPLFKVLNQWLKKYPRVFLVESLNHGNLVLNHVIFIIIFKTGFFGNPEHSTNQYCLMQRQVCYLLDNGDFSIDNSDFSIDDSALSKLSFWNS